MRPTVAIVAFAAAQPLSPRGERALAVAEVLDRSADVDFIVPTGHSCLRRNLRRALSVGSPFLLDACEAEAWLALRRLPIRPSAALLVGFPFSPLYWAARWLVRERVRYVVDIGDPWALTLPPSEAPAMGGVRAARCEEYVWRFASAGVVSTPLQAALLQERFQKLPLIVRPNGYRPTKWPSAASSQARTDRTLRLVHYGNLYESRLDVSRLIGGLARCGEWDSVILTQQGHDWTGILRAMPPAVQVEIYEPAPWEEVVAGAREHDLALVVGNCNPAQLPSKAVQYLTLPIPRLAIAGHERSDSLADYVRDKPGWLTLPWDTPIDFAREAVVSHLRQPWSADTLAPPVNESWEVVAATLAEVLLDRTARPVGEWDNRASIAQDVLASSEKGEIPLANAQRA